MAKRTNTARWTGNRWRIDVQQGGQRRSFYSSTPGRNGQREANAKADAWMDAGIKDAGAKVQAVWAAYLEKVRLSSGTSNYAQIKQFGENYILPVCGRMTMGNLNEGHLQDVLDKAYKNGCLRPGYVRPAGAGPLSRKTLQGIRATEMNFLKWCRQHKYTTLHPEGLTIPAGARLKGKKILQPAALQTLFSVDTRLLYGKRVFDELIYTYRFAVATGVRPGELLGLWVGDVKGRRADLSRAVNVHNEETKGKNQNAVRSFDMNDYAFTAYQAQLQLLRANGVKINYSTRLFPVTSQQALYDRWKKYQQDNGIAPPISLYELRHTFVSLAQDLPDGKLKPLVGHSRNMDTRGVYGHEVTGALEDTAAQLTALLGKVLG